jgi:hypothetical protein
MEKEKLKMKCQGFKKEHKIGFLAWGHFIITIEKSVLITYKNISDYYNV